MREITALLRLLTNYISMASSEIDVTADVRVEKRELIGLMGATGQVTGPHLHWGMVVNGLTVAPEEWTEKDFSSP